MDRLMGGIRKAGSLLLLLAVVCALTPQTTRSKYVLEKTVGTVTVEVSAPADAGLTALPPEDLGPDNTQQGAQESETGEPQQGTQEPEISEPQQDTQEPETGEPQQGTQEPETGETQQDVQSQPGGLLKENPNEEAGQGSGAAILFRCVCVQCGSGIQLVEQKQPERPDLF